MTPASEFVYDNSGVVQISLNYKKYKAYPLYLWKQGDLLAAGEQVGVGIKGLPKRTAQSMLEDKKLDFVIRNFEAQDGTIHKHHFLSRERVMSLRV